MKHRRVSVIGAVALITGCTQPNSNKDNTGNNSGNTGWNNGGNNNSNIGGISQGLEGGVFKVPDSMVSGAETHYMYFSGGIIYDVGQAPGQWTKINTGMSYQGNTIYYPDLSTGMMNQKLVIFSQNGIIFDGYSYSRITDYNIINTIKSPPVSSHP